MKNLEKIWANIRKYSGETFKTKTGVPFSYRTSENTLYFNNTNHAIGKSTIRRALEVKEMTVANLGKAGIHANPYVYGILTDPRIIK